MKNDFNMQDFASHLITGEGKAPINNDSSPIYKIPSNYCVFNGDPLDELEFSQLNYGHSIVFNLKGGTCIKAMRLEVGHNEFEYWMSFADCHVTPESGDVGVNVFLKSFESGCSLLSACFDFYDICVTEFTGGLTFSEWEKKKLIDNQCVCK